MKARLLLIFICLTVLPVHAIPAMMFNSIDQYIERAQGIWIVEVIKAESPSKSIEGGDSFEARVLQTLKGKDNEKTLSVIPVFQQLVPGHRYLVFGFGPMPLPQGTAWLDNGNVSPVAIPPSFSLALLQGKSVKEQLSLILSARSVEIDEQNKRLATEKRAIDKGLEFQKQQDASPSSH